MTGRAIPTRGATPPDASSNRVCATYGCDRPGVHHRDSEPDYSGRTVPLVYCDLHAIPNVVRKSNHPYRLTWTKMARLEIPDETPVGLNKNARGHRRRWHILEDGEPICRQVKGADIGTTTTWGEIEGDRPCDRCHHEFSWTPLPHDTEERDLGYETPCWVWTRGLDDDGYGQFGRKGRHLGTHRAAYIAEYGEPPEGYVVHHLCGQAPCLRPDHLQAMPRSEHIRLHKPELAPGSAALKRKP